MKLTDNLRGKVRAYSIGSIIVSGFVYLAQEFSWAYRGRELVDPYVLGAVSLFLLFFGAIGWALDQAKPDIWRTAKLAVISVGLTVLTVFLLSIPAQAMEKVPQDLTVASTEVKRDGLPTWEQTAVYAVPLTKKWEGTGPTFACRQSASGVCVRAYLDTIAEPDLPTICYGETSHTGTKVRMGDVRTIEECDAGLSRIMRDQYWTAYRRGVTITTLHPATDAAFTDLAWNVGPRAVLKASALIALNRGDIADACHRTTFYNKSGGRVVRGLVNRRADDYEVCMIGAA